VLYSTYLYIADVLCAPVQLVGTSMSVPQGPNLGLSMPNMVVETGKIVHTYALVLLRNVNSDIGSETRAWQIAEGD